MSKRERFILPHALSLSLSPSPLYHSTTTNAFPSPHSHHACLLSLGWSKSHLVDHLNLLLVRILGTGSNRTTRFPTSVDGDLGLVVLSLLEGGDESGLNIGPSTIVKRLRTETELAPAIITKA